MAPSRLFYYSAAAMTSK